MRQHIRKENAQEFSIDGAEDHGGRKERATQEVDGRLAPTRHREKQQAEQRHEEPEVDEASRVRSHREGQEHHYSYDGNAGLPATSRHSREHQRIEKVREDSGRKA